MDVWAHRIGNFKPAKDCEWDETFKFDTLASLINQFSDKKVALGQIRKLAIVAHGDVGGLVQLAENDLTPKNVQLFSKELLAIEKYLSSNARIIFYSCIAASGREGTRLLNALSSDYFPGRHLIGFERYGVVPQEGLLVATGDVPCSAGGTDSQHIFACESDPNPGLVIDARKRAQQLLSEYSIYAKWSYRGGLIKIPYSEIEQVVATENKIVYGRQAVLDALRKDSKKIKYIAMKNIPDPLNRHVRPTKDVEKLYMEVQPYGFVEGPPAAKVRELTLNVWKSLPSLYGPAHSYEKETVLAVYEESSLRKFKCA